jgi:hypothetical protein
MDWLITIGNAANMLDVAGCTPDMPDSIIMQLLRDEFEFPLDVELDDLPCMRSVVAIARGEEIQPLDDWDWYVPGCESWIVDWLSFFDGCEFLDIKDACERAMFAGV